MSEVRLFEVCINHNNNTKRTAANRKSCFIQYFPPGTINAHRFLTEGPINIIIKYSSEEGKLRAKQRTEERYRVKGAQSRYKKELPNLNVEVQEVDSFDEYLALEADEDVEYVEEGKLNSDSNVCVRAWVAAYSLGLDQFSIRFCVDTTLTQF